MQNFLSYLDTIYNNCNQHLLEQGKKRDQVITFYIVLISFVLTNFGNLENDFFGPITKIFIYAILLIIGMIVLLNLADLRSWHTQYLDVIYVINWAQANYERYSSIKSLEKNMKKLMEAPINVKPRPKKKLSGAFIKYWFFGSTDNTIYTGMIFITSLSILGMYGQCCKFIKLTPNIQIIVGVIVYVIGCGLLLWHFEKLLQNKIEDGEKYNTWILSFDYNGQLKDE